MAYEAHARTTADALAPMAAQVGDVLGGVRIPIGPITAPLRPRRTHEIGRVAKSTARILLSELRNIAREVDERDSSHPGGRRGNWAKRLSRFSLMVLNAGQGPAEADALGL